MSIGPLFGVAQLVGEAEATLREWLGPTLAHVNDVHTLELTVPDDYLLAPTADAVREVDRVTVAVVSPGIVGTPDRNADGLYDARFALVLSAFVRGDDYTNTLREAAGYAVALRTALAQHPELGGHVSDLVWTGEDVLPVAGDASTTRTLALAVVEFEATVPSILDEHGTAELTDEPGDGPTVVRTEVTLTPKE